MVEAAFKRLLDSYLASPHRKKVELITKAYNFACQAHAGVKRLSGEPYIMHPLAVALIASEEMGLGSTSICSALLHDIVEDTDYTVEDIENLFGKKIAQIVDGLTKISGGLFGDRASAQAENFKKLLLTMSDDIRVILIKMCDRLHNMRTLEAQPPNKQYKIAGETLYIYAPLANRLGLYKIKTELENLSFKFEHPDTFADISEKLAETQAQREELFGNFTAPIKEVLDELGVNYSIKARVKSPYSIWNKMQTKHVSFDQIYDILAVRIVYDVDNIKEEIDECFRIYVAISKLYKAHPDRLRDWLNHPKANGYQALHVTLMSHQGRWVEVQIRSNRMEDLAENGFAAHWRYKSSEAGEADKLLSSGEAELDSWIGTIKEILDDPQPDAMDFLDSIKLNLFASEIFVFSPKGEIKTMPQGSTALDFAFSIHSFLGTHCIGAKVNHKLVPLSYKLQSGDQIEILTSSSQKVHAEWRDVVTTAKARSKIQMALRKEAREQMRKGETMLNEWLENQELTQTSSVIDRLCRAHSSSREQLFINIARETIALDDKTLAVITGKKRGAKWKRFVPFLKSNTDEQVSEVVDAKTSSGRFVVTKDFNKKQPLILNDENLSSFHFSDCCNPIPGDDVLGYITDNKEVAIHQRKCSVADRLKSTYGNRILDAIWNTHSSRLFDAKIVIRGIDRKGMLHDVAEVISNKLNVNIKRITITTNDGIFEGTIEVLVYHRSEVQEMANHLMKIKGLKEVNQL